jgi:recombination protein RecR
MNLPKFIQEGVDAFEMLPGIGPKSAQRLAFYMLKLPKDQVGRFADSIKNLKAKALMCSSCFNVTENAICTICSDRFRNSHSICVVETPMDLISIEKTGYKGLYHVLHGSLNPIAGIGPEEIMIPQLLKRVEESPEITEVILATGTSVEGETTASYIKRELKNRNPLIKITRLGRGLPVGADIEYTDESTLNDALTSRIEY